MFTTNSFAPKKLGYQQLIKTDGKAFTMLTP